MPLCTSGKVVGMVKHDFKEQVIKMYRMRTHPKKVCDMTKEERILAAKGIVLAW